MAPARFKSPSDGLGGITSSSRGLAIGIIPWLATMDWTVVSSKANSPNQSQMQD